MNSFNLGRYWPSAGPQQTLYVPGPWTAQTGDNKAPKLTIFELETSNPSITVELVEQPQLQVTFTIHFTFLHNQIFLVETFKTLQIASVFPSNHVHVY